MRRLHAFTLLEVLLSLLLLGVLGTFAILALQNLRSGVNGLSSVLNKNEELLWFCAAVRADIEGARYIHAHSSNSLTCVSDTGQVHYAVWPDHITRSTSGGQEFRFDLAVVKTTAHLFHERSSLIALWVLDLEDQAGGKHIAFRKVYSASDLIRERTDSGHANSYP